jgi:integrase
MAMPVSQVTQSARSCDALGGASPAKFGTHSLQRTKTVLIYRRAGSLRAVQLLLGHSKIESMVRHLDEVDYAIEIAEKIDI